MVEDARVEVITAPTSELLRSIRALCDDAFGAGFTDADWAHTLGGTHVVLSVDDVLVAHAALVERAMVVGGRPMRVGYAEGVATVTAHQSRGFGSMVMAETHRVIATQFDLGALSTSAVDFYARLGWERWQGATWVDTAGGRLRTPDEDDGIMLLRGATPIEVTDDLICTERDGDDW